MLALLLFAAAPLPATLSGIVVDRKGEPVAGAVVAAHGWKRVETKSDDMGRWTLRTPLGGPALLFASKDGFRFHGQLLGGGKIVLARRTEKPGREMQSLPLLPMAKRMELALEVAKDEFAEGLNSKIEPQRAHVLKNLARLDPARAIEELDKKPLSAEWDGAVRCEAARHLLPLDIAEARAVAESAKSPIARSRFLIHLHDHLPASKKAERKKALDDALVALKGATSAEFVLMHRGRIARLLHEMGETEQAAKLFEEGRAAAEKLPKSWVGDSIRGKFAVEYATVDRDGAFALLKGMATEERQHALHDLSRRLAATDPEGSETALKAILPGQTIKHAGPLAPVCGPMAAKDYLRARRIAEQAEGQERAWTLGAMALGLGAKDKRQAARLLDEAFGLLEKEARRPGFHALAADALGLLPVAEAIDPALVPECLWRALSFYQPSDTKPKKSYRTRATAPALIAVALRIASLLTVAFVVSGTRFDP